MEQTHLNSHSIYAIPVGHYFNAKEESCQLVYAPINNAFFLATPSEVEELEHQVCNNAPGEILRRLIDTKEPPLEEISPDTFCTLHLLLNEKCNFSCSYCYSAKGRSSKEMSMETIRPVLKHFLSSERKAPHERTIMFMGGGEPTLSWPLLVDSTLEAERIGKAEGVKPFFSLTTNGSIMTDEMLAFLREHDFTIQISFEMLPDVQRAQRGNYEIVATNINRICAAGVKNYVRSTITAMNVGRICEMVEHCHNTFPDITKLSCQHVVDNMYFKDTDTVDRFFDTYFTEFHDAALLAEKYGITLRSSASHLINYSKRQRFCYNIVCLTPYGTLTTCPDISSPKEDGYNEALIGRVERGQVRYDVDGFLRNTSCNIYDIEKCRQCYARWNCGSGCPSSRKVYRENIFDAICHYYRRMLTHSLITAIAQRYSKSTGRDLIADIKTKL